MENKTIIITIDFKDLDNLKGLEEILSDAETNGLIEKFKIYEENA